MTTLIDQNSSIQECLGKLKCAGSLLVARNSSSKGNIHRIWKALYRAWWQAIVNIRKLCGAGECTFDETLLDWPSFVRKALPDSNLQLLLEHLHRFDWQKVCEKSELPELLIDIAYKLGLRTSICTEPWLLYLYFGPRFLGLISRVKELKCLMNYHRSRNVPAAYILNSITYEIGVTELRYADILHSCPGSHWNLSNESFDNAQTNLNLWFSPADVRDMAVLDRAVLDREAQYDAAENAPSESEVSDDSEMKSSVSSADSGYEDEYF